MWILFKCFKLKVKSQMDAVDCLIAIDFVLELCLWSETQLMRDVSS